MPCLIIADGNVCCFNCSHRGQPRSSEERKWEKEVYPVSYMHISSRSGQNMTTRRRGTKKRRERIEGGALDGTTVIH